MSTSGHNEQAKRGFIYSAGAVCLFITTSFWLANVTSQTDLAPPHDPVFQLPVPAWYGIAGAVGLAVALACFFWEDTRLPNRLIGWWAVGFIGVRFGLTGSGLTSGLNGYWGPLADVFAIQAGTVDGWLIAASLYLLVGSLLFRTIECRPTAKRPSAN